MKPYGDLEKQGSVTANPTKNNVAHTEKWPLGSSRSLKSKAYQAKLLRKSALNPKP